MNKIDKAIETQMKNIESKTGKSLEELTRFILASKLSKHSELRDMVREKFQLGYGDANMLVHVARGSANLNSSSSAPAEIEAAVDRIYSAKKEPLRSLHAHVMKEIHKLGEFEIAPKKAYLSLRRKKQFAMVGPGTKGRLEIGLNMKSVPGTERLEELPPGGMCQYRVFLNRPSDVDQELIGWIRTAYESAV